MSKKRLSDKFEAFEKDSIEKTNVISKPIMKDKDLGINDIINIDSIDDCTSDQLRTAYFLITKKSTRKTKSDIIKELREILNKKAGED